MNAIEEKNNSVKVLTGWGCTSPSRSTVVTLNATDDVSGIMKSVPARVARRGLLARGLGRSYNDAAQNAGGVVAILNRGDGESDGRIEIDADRGSAVVGAGASLAQLMEAALPLGWFVPVTPGTRHVTIGGAIAADVHGKNHHGDGSIGNFVTSLVLDAPIGRLTLSPDAASPDVVRRFWATLGGMGLTGIVRSVALKLVRVETSLMTVDTRRVDSLDAVLRLLGDDESRYSVAWVDALATGRHLGRGVVTSGDHATQRDVSDRAAKESSAAGFPRSITVPNIGLNVVRPTLTKAFNELWFRKAPRQRDAELQTISTFFHPLDGADRWNRLYGPAGFLQWQCAVPLHADGVVRYALERLSRKRLASPVVVLKRFGSANPGPLSFPFPGWTLAVDIPAGADGASGVLDELDTAVVEAGGRVYLAKDARLRSEHLAAMYPRLEEWRETRDSLDPDRLMQSDLARRLGLITPRTTCTHINTST